MDDDVVDQGAARRNKIIRAKKSQGSIMMGHEDDASSEVEGLEIEEDGDEGQLKF